MHKNVPRIYFFVFGLLDLAALLTAFFYSLQYVIDYFSYFTILSNILITFVFLSFGLGNSKKSLAAKVYAPSVLYMCITGIVFWTILKGGHGVHHSIVIPWVNIVLHGITPLVAILGFLLFPPAKKLNYSEIWRWLLFPLIFVFYSLVRGPIAHWYPYVILNPATAGGYAGVAKYVTGILVGAYILGIILVFLASLRKKTTK